MLDVLAADSDAQTAEFDWEWRRALFKRAADQVRAEVEPQTWQAFWETGVVGTSPAKAAQKLGMSAGGIRVAKCRVLARLRAVVKKMESTT
jgi:RNA polymerase sigma-70 factor (ECF subfamily)